MSHHQDRRKLFFDWGVSSYFGWGVYGLNLMRVLADDPHFQPLTTSRVGRDRIVLDESDARRIGPLLDSSEKFQDILGGHAGKTISVRSPVLHSLGTNLARVGQTVHGVDIVSDRMAGVTFFEDANIRPDSIERCQAYRLVVAGSSWNRSVLTDLGLRNAISVPQGIDTRIFQPGAKTGLFGDRFTVFSGGKLERRKGQDLVLRAFKVLRQRHDDVVLMTAWHSPWDATAARGMSGLPDIAPIPLRDGKDVDVEGWAAANAIPAGAVHDLGRVPNSLMASIYREMDVAVFANRCEGGTNLVAMEAMACGVPAIVSANTGHLDLILPGTCLALSRQDDRDGNGSGWRESAVDEIVEHLESLYQDRDRARAIGANGARFMAGWDWQVRIQELKGHLLEAFA